jgi:tetratricopeptide (TPR) repeat protein
MSPEEVRDFEIHLLECAECQREVAEGAAIRVALLASPVEGAGWLPRRLLSWVVPLAAAAALATWFLLPADDALSRLGGVGAAPGLVSLPVRAGSATAASAADRGMEAYREGEYRKAVELLQEAAASERGPGVRFFLGLSQLLSGSPREATASLRAALEPEGNPYAAEANFYLAKAWLRLGNADSALSRLGAVSPGSGETRSRAEALADSVRRAMR